MNGIKRGSWVRVSKVVIEAIDDGVVRALMFDELENADGIVVSIWKYPPDDRKFEVQLKPPNYGRLIVSESDIGG